MAYTKMNNEDAGGALNPVSPPVDTTGMQAIPLPKDNSKQAKAGAMKMPAWLYYSIVVALVVGIAALVYFGLLMQKEGVNSAIKRQNDGSQMGIVATTIPGLQMGYRGYWDSQ